MALSTRSDLCRARHAATDRLVFPRRFIRPNAASRAYSKLSICVLFLYCHHVIFINKSYYRRRAETNFSNALLQHLLLLLLFLSSSSSSLSSSSESRVPIHQTPVDGLLCTRIMFIYYYFTAARLPCVYYYKHINYL